MREMRIKFSENLDIRGSGICRSAVSVIARFKIVLS